MIVIPLGFALFVFFFADLSSHYMFLYAETLYIPQNIPIRNPILRTFCSFLLGTVAPFVFFKMVFRGFSGGISHFLFFFSALKKKMRQIDSVKTLSICPISHFLEGRRLGIFGDNSH